MIAIGFSTTSKLSSALIRWRTKVPELPPDQMPSHAWLLHDAYGSEYVMEAEWSGFRVISFAQFKNANRIIDIVPVSDRMARRNVDARARVYEAAEWLGDSYDWKGILGFALPRLLLAQSPKALLCSEAVVRSFPELFPGLDPERASPAQLLVRLQQPA